MMETSSIRADILATLDTLQDPKPGWNEPSTVISITAVSMGIAFICIIFRLYTRLWVVRSPGWDDAFVTLYLMTGIMAGVSLCISTEYGTGQHLITLIFEPTKLKTFLKTFYICNAAMTMSMTIVKMSLLVQYLRVFERRYLRWLCMLVLVLVSLVGLAYTVLSWVPCWPVSDYWFFDYANGTKKNCWGFASTNHNEFYHTYLSWNILNLVGDLAILCLPLPLFFDRGMERRTKLGLIGLVVLGAIANFLCIWRLVETIRNRAGTYPTFDPTWNAPIIMVLAILEVNLSSVCASVPVFWPVLTAQIGKVFVTREIHITHTSRESMLQQQQQQQQTQASQMDDFAWTHGDKDNDDEEESDCSSSDFEKLTRVISPVRSPFSTRNNSVVSKTKEDDDAPHGRRGRDGSVSSSLSTMLMELEKGGSAQQQQHYGDRFVQGQVDPLSRQVEYAVECAGSRKGSRS